jgi:hypothetical protein
MIRHARREIADELHDSPTLRALPERLLPEVYPEAHEDAADETGLPMRKFPNICRWSVDQVLDPDFWPDAPESAGRGSPSPQLGPGPQPAPRRRPRSK